MRPTLLGASVALINATAFGLNIRCRVGLRPSEVLGENPLLASALRSFRSSLPIMEKSCFLVVIQRCSKFG